VVSAIDHLTNEKVAIKKLAKIEDMVIFVKSENI
jgi:hypothetical protein